MEMGNILNKIYQIFFSPFYSHPSTGLIKDLEEIHKKSIYIEGIAESIESVLEPYHNYSISTTKNPRLTKRLERLTQNLDEANHNLEYTLNSIKSIPGKIDPKVPSSFVS